MCNCVYFITIGAYALWFYFDVFSHPLQVSVPCNIFYWNDCNLVSCVEINGIVKIVFQNLPSLFFKLVYTFSQVMIALAIWVICEYISLHITFSCSIFELLIWRRLFIFRIGKPFTFCFKTFIHFLAIHSWIWIIAKYVVVKLYLNWISSWVKMFLYVQCH